MQEQTQLQVKHQYVQILSGAVFRGVPFSSGVLSTVFSCTDTALCTSGFLEMF